MCIDGEQFANLVFSDTIQYLNLKLETVPLPETRVRGCLPERSDTLSVAGDRLNLSTADLIATYTLLEMLFQFHFDYLYYIKDLTLERFYFTQ